MSYVKSGFKNPYHKIGATEPILNYYLAGMYCLKITNRLDVGAELQLSRKGYSYTIYNYFEIEKLKAKRTLFAASVNIVPYLELLRKENKKQSKSFGILAGYYTAIIYDNKWTFGNNNPVSVDKAMKHYDMGLITGLRLKRVNKMGNTLSIDIRYCHGISDISENYENTSFRTFEIGFSYAHRCMKK